MYNVCTLYMYMYVHVYALYVLTTISFFPLSLSLSLPLLHFSYYLESLDLAFCNSLSLALCFSSSRHLFLSLAKRSIRSSVSYIKASFTSLSNGESVWKLGDLFTSISQGLSFRSRSMSNPSISKQALPLV